MCIHISRVVVVMVVVIVIMVQWVWHEYDMDACNKTECDATTSAGFFYVGCGEGGIHRP